MELSKFKERFILVKQPLGSGKSYQARKLDFKRTLQLTSTRALASETSRVTGYHNYQTIEHSVPLTHIDKLVVLAPSLHRLQHDFIPFDLLVIDESEAVFDDIFSGLCKGPNFEIMMQVFMLLMKTTGKIVMLDGYLRNSTLSICANFCENLQDIRLVISTYKIQRGTLQELPPPLRQSNKSPYSPNNIQSVEGLLNLIAEKQGTEFENELRLKLFEGTLFWRVKISFLEQGYLTFGPINSVKKYMDFAANNLWQYAKWSIHIQNAVKRIFDLSISLDSCHLIGKYMTGNDPRWSCFFYHKEAINFETDDDLSVAMEIADDFAFTSRLSSGVSFDKQRYDIITGYFSPQSNLPTSGAQQLMRNRNVRLKSGIIAFGNDCNLRNIVKPLGFSLNKRRCLSRESFSLNLLDDQGNKHKTLRVLTPDEFRPLYFHHCNLKSIAARPALYKKMMAKLNYESGFQTMELGKWENSIKITQYLYAMLGKLAANLIASMSGIF